MISHATLESGPGWSPYPRCQQCRSAHNERGKTRLWNKPKPKRSSVSRSS